MNFLEYAWGAQIILETFAVLYLVQIYRRLRYAHKIDNYVKITSHHREIWALILEDSDLEDILSDDNQHWTRSLTKKEFVYVGFLINHLSVTFELLQIDELIRPHGLDVDIKTFFALPIPHRVWNEKKIFHSQDFVRFVETRMKQPG